MEVFKITTIHLLRIFIHLRLLRKFALVVKVRCEKVIDFNNRPVTRQGIIIE